MSKNEHRFGVSEANLVVRRLKLEDPDRTRIDPAIDEINQIRGVDNIIFDPHSTVLNISYDASRICLDCIEEVLTKHDVVVSRDWWTRFKKGHYRFVDQNVKDNAADPPWSCHNHRQ